jgi:hypothetical protein
MIMGVSGPKWIIWWKADFAHAIHPNHLPDPGKGFGSGSQDGLAYCGKTIPARGTYPPNVICDRCPVCKRYLTDEQKRLDAQKRLDNLGV